MSERVLHEWTYWDAQSNGVSCSVEGEVGNPYRARVLAGSEYQLALEILNLAARIAELEAEVAVLSGTACAEEQAEGNGPCGACRTCRNKRITELEAENAKLRKCVKAGDNYIDSIYSITSNTGLLHAEWNEKIDYYAARAEVDK